jgi:hypothetical protein
MVTLTELINRVQTLNSRTEQIAEEAITETSEAYLSLNATQLSQGLDKEGNAITLDGAGYSPYTKDLKEKYGQGIGAITDHVTLYQTGVMYQSETLGVSNRFINLHFNTPYSDEVIARTGDQVLGLNADSRNEYISGFFLPALRPKVVDIMKIEFE